MLSICSISWRSVSVDVLLHSYRKYLIAWEAPSSGFFSWYVFVDDDKRRSLFRIISGNCMQICDRQIRLHCPQVNFWSRLGVGVVWFFLHCLLIQSLTLQVSSKEETIWWVMFCQAIRFAAIVDHLWWSVWQAPKYFSGSPCFSYSVPLSLWPLDIGADIRLPIYGNLC